MLHTHKKKKNGENTGIMVFWSKEQMLEILIMKEVRNSVGAYFGRDKDSWMEW